MFKNDRALAPGHKTTNRVLQPSVCPRGVSQAQLSCTRSLSATALRTGQSSRTHQTAKRTMYPRVSGRSASELRGRHTEVKKCKRKRRCLRTGTVPQQLSGVEGISCWRDLQVWRAGKGATGEGCTCAMHSHKNSNPTRPDDLLLQSHCCQIHLLHVTPRAQRHLQRFHLCSNGHSLCFSLHDTNSRKFRIIRDFDLRTTPTNIVLLLAVAPPSTALRL